MKWSKEAEEAVSKVPFFVRKMVRKKVENEASQHSSNIVTLAHVNISREKFLKNMEEEFQGYRLETCFGSDTCPNSVISCSDTAEQLSELLASKNLKAFLEQKVHGPLKIHHEFTVTISECPNACSRPQIADIGIIGACQPEILEEQCNRCGSCTEVCRENAIAFLDDKDCPVLNDDKCLYCGQCMQVCPCGAIKVVQKGFRVFVGGKMGRHPQFGHVLKGIHKSEEVLHIVNQCLDHYVKYNQCGERLGEILNRTGLKKLQA